MGSHVRLVIGEPGPGMATRDEAAAAARDSARSSTQRLSRFIPDSELCALNDDPRSACPPRELLRAAVSAGLWAAERSGGLVDPTLSARSRRRATSPRAPA